MENAQLLKKHKEIVKYLKKFREAATMVGKSTRTVLKLSTH
jgi:hypothetical protein